MQINQTLLTGTRADGRFANSCGISACVGSPADDYHEIAAKQAADRAAEDATWQVEKARRAAMKPAEWALLKPAFQDPTNDPKGD